MTSELFNFKLEFAHRFDRVKQLLKVILRFVGHSISSDAFPKKNGEKIPMGSYIETVCKICTCLPDALSGQTYRTSKIYPIESIKADKLIQLYA